jgi:hypothetical protein
VSDVLDPPIKERKHDVEVAAEAGAARHVAKLSSQVSDATASGLERQGQQRHAQPPAAHTKLMNGLLVAPQSFGHLFEKALRSLFEERYDRIVRALNGNTHYRYSDKNPIYKVNMAFIERIESSRHGFVIRHRFNIY